MNDLRKAEFYKLWHSKSFFVILLLSILLDAVMMMDNQMPASASDCFYSALYHTPILYLLIIIFGALFVGEDFDSRTIASYVSAGHKRGHILLAKCTSYLVGSVLILGVPLLLIGAVGGVLFGLSAQISLLQIVTELFLIVLAICAMGILPFFFAVVFRDVGKTLAIPMILFFLMIFALNSDSAMTLARLLPMGQLRLASEGILHLSWNTILIDGAWIIVGYFGAERLFCRMDLK